MVTLATSRFAIDHGLQNLMFSTAHDGGLFTNPPDNFCKEAINPVVESHGLISKNSNSTVEMKIKTSTTPGIVARLMGLDSFPAEFNFVPTALSSQDSIDRSRSVNSVNFCSEFDPKQGQMHRRVRNEGKSKELRSNGRKSEMGIEDMKQRKSEKCENKNRGERISGKKQKELAQDDQHLIRDLGSIPEKKTDECRRRTSMASKEKIQCKPPGNPNEEVSDGTSKLLAAKKKKNRHKVDCSPDSVLDPYSISLSEPETFLPVVAIDRSSQGVVEAMISVSAITPLAPR
ncbi:hypothetical protein BVC80_9077g38 [Macleaya cordata]|uniref:DUF3741 domain-containing protein n=1 Tax=Macleaya cordata TaxID=56857 RepID=A0A200PLN3_MACCD|nr:hypothetical protein BVC80_9077g38 [Macleaya cordata]